MGSDRSNIMIWARGPQTVLANAKLALSIVLGCVVLVVFAGCNGHYTTHAGTASPVFSDSRAIQNLVDVSYRLPADENVDELQNLSQQTYQAESWIKLPVGKSPPSNRQLTKVYQTVQIDEVQAKNGAILLENCAGNVTAYLGGEKIYQYAQNIDAFSPILHAMGWHFIDIPAGATHQRLYFMVESHRRGLLGCEGPLSIGDKSDIIIAHLHANFIWRVLAIICVIGGLMGLIVTLTVYRDLTNLSVSLFLLTASLFVGIHSFLSQYVENDIGILDTAQVLAVYFFTAFMVMFVRGMLAPHFSRALLIIAATFFAFALGAMLMPFCTNQVVASDLMIFYLIIAIFAVPYVVGVIIWYATYKKDIEIIVLAASLTIFIILGVLEGASSMRLIPVRPYMNWGILVFVFGAVYISVSRIIKALWAQERSRFEAENRALIEQVETVKALTRMAGGMAHELNNPLFVISSSNAIIADLLRLDKNVDFKNYSEYTDRIARMTERISSISNSLLLLARSNADTRHTLVLLDELLESAKTYCLDQYDCRSHDLIKIDCGPKIFVYGIRHQLLQVFLALFDNAIDAVSQEKERWVKVECAVNVLSVKIRVIDSGPGIPAGIRQDIFMPFFSTKEVGKGKGLSLCISRSIIESHGGHIFLKEDHPHTCFDITLPLGKAHVLGKK